MSNKTKIITLVVCILFVSVTAFAFNKVETTRKVQKLHESLSSENKSEILSQTNETIKKEYLDSLIKRASEIYNRDNPNKQSELDDKINDINDRYAGPNGMLHRNGNITSLDNTLFEQICEFYYRNVTKKSSFTLGLIDSFVSSISSNIVPPGYGFIINIEDTTVYNKTGKRISPINDSVIVIPSKRLIHGIYNETELIGPYIVEVIVWK